MMRHQVVLMLWWVCGVQVALKGKHAQERLVRKQQQVEQLAGLGESKEHKTAASQLEALSQEIKVSILQCCWELKASSLVF